MSETLKNCPFCGGKAQGHSGRVAEDAMEAFVRCMECHASTDYFEDAYSPLQDAVATWNRRADASLSTDLAAAQEEIERLKRERDEARAERDELAIRALTIDEALTNAIQREQALAADNARLREALEPFKNCANISDGHQPDLPDSAYVLVRIGHLRGARTALQGGNDAR